MDRSHRIDAPDESLNTVEQLEDHSNVSSIYPQAHKSWEGQEIVSAEERERRRLEKENTISFGIRRQFLTLGILIPLPLIIAALILTGTITFMNDQNASILTFPLILLVLIWLSLTLLAIRKVFEIFYKHALRAGPFFIVLLALLGMSVQIVYVLTMPIHASQPLQAALLVSVIECVWSVFLCFILLFVWTTPRLSGNAKFGVISIVALCLLLTATVITLL